MVEFRVYDKDNNLIDCIGPVETMDQCGTSCWIIDTGYLTYEVEVPEGGRYEIT